MDSRKICYPIGLGLCILALVIWAKGSGLLAGLCTLSGLTIMVVGDYHAR